MSNRNFYRTQYQDKSNLITERDLFLQEETSGFLNSGFLGSMIQTAKYTYNYDDEMQLYRNSMDFEKNTMLETITDEDDKRRFIAAQGVVVQNQERGKLLEYANEDGIPNERSVLGQGVDIFNQAINNAIEVITLPSRLGTETAKKITGNKYPDMSYEEAKSTLQDLRQKYDSPFKTEEDIITNMRKVNQEQAEILQATIEQNPIRGFIGSFAGGMAADPFLALNRSINDGEHLHALAYSPVGLPLKGISLGAKALSRAGSGFALNAGTEAFLQYEYIEDFQNIVLENDEYGQKDIITNILISGFAGAAFSAGVPYIVERIQQPRLINNASNTIDNILNVEGAKGFDIAELNTRRDEVSKTINKEKEKVSTYYNDGIKSLKTEQRKINENINSVREDIAIDNNRTDYYIRESEDLIGNNRSEKYTEQLNKNIEYKNKIQKKRKVASDNINNYNKQAKVLKSRIDNLKIDSSRTEFETEFNTVKREIAELEKQIKNTIPDLKRTSEEYINDINMFKNTFELKGKQKGLKGKELRQHINTSLRNKFGIEEPASANNIKSTANRMSREINQKVENNALNEIENIRTELQINKLNKVRSEVEGVFSNYKTDGDLRNNLKELNQQNNEVVSFVDRMTDDIDLNALRDLVQRNYNVLEQPDQNVLNLLNNTTNQARLMDNINSVKVNTRSNEFEMMRQNEMIVRAVESEAGDIKDVNSNLLINGLKNYINNITGRNKKFKLNELEEHYFMNERKFFAAHKEELDNLFDQGLSYKQLEDIIRARVEEYNNDIRNNSTADKITKRMNKGINNNIQANTDGITQLREEDRTTLNAGERILQTTDENKLRLLDNEVEIENLDGTRFTMSLKQNAENMKKERESLANILTCMLS